MNKDKKAAFSTWMIFFARVFSFGLGFFSLCNLASRLLSKGLDANLWWLDIHWFPSHIQIPCMVIASLGLLFFAIGKLQKKSLLLLVFFCSLGLLFVSIQNTVQYIFLIHTAELSQAPIFPFSFFVSMLLLVIMGGVFRSLRTLDSPSIKKPGPTAWFFFGIGTLLLIPSLQMITFGKTDYRRSADAVVVFGARTYKNGQPGISLRHRVSTASMLYHQGFAHTLIFSGGPGDGETHETEAMKRLAVSLGVPAEHILLDPFGISTQKTVDNTLFMFQKHSFRRILVVSDFSHLVRIKLCYAQKGQAVYTVPAEGKRPRTLVLFQMARETAALWFYYAKGLFGG